jgi:cytochrome c oxidase assembly factor CtaG
MGLFPAPIFSVTDRTADVRSSRAVAGVRQVMNGLAVVLLALSLMPPLGIYARRFEFVEALQFCLLAIVVPVMVVCGAGWRQLGLAVAPPPAIGDDGDLDAPGGLRPVDRLAIGRRRHSEPWRAVVVAGVFLTVVLLWRIPLSVDALARHPWLVAFEAATLVPTGVALWLELVESPPLLPRLTRPNRVAMATVVMWVIWVLAYLVGLSHGAWYHGFDHSLASGISISADQQLTTGVVWIVSGAAFVPVVFWNLIFWLQSEEDPDDELYRLVRQERSRGQTLGQEADPGPD